MGYLLYTIAFILCFQLYNCSNDQILKPPKAGKPEIAIIHIPGASIPPERYLPLYQKLQTIFSGRLWVGIPAFTLDVPEPLEMSGAVKRITQSLTTAGMPANTPIYFAAHSLGCVMVQLFLTGNNFPTPGVILMGGVVTRDNRPTWRIPTLTIGGELDGLCRVTRVAESYWHYIINPNGTKPSDYPVVVIEGLNHIQMASGTPPLFVWQNDLKAEITLDSSHTQISNTISSFVMSHHTKQVSNVLEKKVFETGNFLDPIIASLVQEGFYHFKPPCYNNPPSNACTLGSPWIVHTQELMANVGPVGGQVKATNEIHAVWEIPFHLPHIFNTCKPKDPTCFLNISTVCENVYDNFDNYDTGFTHTSAYEMKTKLKSRQSAYEALGIQIDFNVTDGGDLCADINDASYQYAIKNAASKTISRFNHYGIPMKMVRPDLGPYNVGPEWIWKNMVYTDTPNAETIQSVMMKTPTDYWITEAAGYHYCKFLSPARSMEWVYIDGLRAHYGINVTYPDLY